MIWKSVAIYEVQKLLFDRISGKLEQENNRTEIRKYKAESERQLEWSLGFTSNYFGQMNKSHKV